MGSALAHALLLGLAPCGPESWDQAPSLERVELVLMTTEFHTDPTPLDDSLPLESDAASNGSAGPAASAPPKSPSQQLATASAKLEDTSAKARAPDSERPSRLTAASAMEDEHSAPTPTALADDAHDNEPETLTRPKSKPDDPLRERYVHATKDQSDEAPVDGPAISSANRRADEEQRSTVVTKAEGTYAPPSATAGTAGSVAGLRPTEEGREEDPNPVHAETQAASAARETAQTDAVDPADSDHGRLGPTQDAVTPPAPPPPTQARDAADAVAEVDIAGTPALSESGKNVPVVEVPDWWEAGASRPAGAPEHTQPGSRAEVARPAVEDPQTPPVKTTPPQPPSATQDVDDLAAAQTKQNEADTDGESDDGTTEEDQADGVRRTPLEAPTDLFRESMGWRAGGSPGQDQSGAPSASNQVVTKQQATAAEAAVNTQRTPQGVYTAHIERTLMEGWYDTNISIEQRALGARGEVTVLFRIRRSGRVADLVLTRSSGDAHMDHLALNAVPKRFARFPSELMDRFLIFEWTFHYRD